MTSCGPMDDGIERVILTNEELLEATAAILNEQLSPNVSLSTHPDSETDFHSIRFCRNFLSPIHEPHFPVNHLQFNFNSLPNSAESNQPIDPRLKENNLTINHSILNPNLLEPISSDPRSNLASEALPKPRRSAKRRKTNLKTSHNKYLHAFDIPTCPAELTGINAPQPLSVNEINFPTNFPEQSQHRISEKPDSFTPSRESGWIHDDPTNQPIQQRPSSSISAILHTVHSTHEGSEAIQAESSVLLHSASSSCSPAEPNIHPLLQTINPSLPAPPLGSSIGQAGSHCIQIVRKTAEPKYVFVSPTLPTHPASYPAKSLIDVHGAGAGGGAATVLAAVAAQQSITTTEPAPQSDPIVIANMEEIQAGGFGNASAEPLPTSYNPDQFRSCNRIHWTQEEEDLLQVEVELNWERYDCMAQIMKRHGPNGSVSKAFADRTAVSLKDKAVNVRPGLCNARVHSSRLMAFFSPSRSLQDGTATAPKLVPREDAPSPASGPSNSGESQGTNCLEWLRWPTRILVLAPIATSPSIPLHPLAATEYPVPCQMFYYTLTLSDT